MSWMYATAPARTAALEAFGPEAPHVEATSHLCVVGNAILRRSNSAFKPSRYFRSTWLCGWRFESFAVFEMCGGEEVENACSSPVRTVFGRPRLRGAAVIVGEDM